MGHQAEPDAGALQHRTLGRFETGLVAANRAIIVIMMVGMVGLVFINVLSRYLLNTSIVWAEELSQFLMVWIVFLGAGLGFREGRHVAVEFFQDLLPVQLRHRVRVGIFVGLVLFLLGLLVLGLRYAHFAADQQTPVLNISYAIPYLCLPLGALLFLCHLWLVRDDFIAGRVEAPENLESSMAEDH